MPNYLYVGDKTREQIKKLRLYSRCAVCGGKLWEYYDSQRNEPFVACKDNFEHGDKSHTGIAKPAYLPDTINILKEREELAKMGVNTDIVKYSGTQALTKPAAKEIVKTIWPKAPEIEVTKAALVCWQYQLNPLMKQVFLIPFNEGKSGETWAMVLGIKAKRLIASRKHHYSYLDETPRVMTEDEQRRIFGEVDQANVVAITILQDEAGNHYRGYGKWPRDKSPYGSDKGNSKANMAFIRSESQALEKLAPGELPSSIEVGDEEFISQNGKTIVASTGAIIEEQPVKPTVVEAKAEVVGETIPPTDKPARDPDSITNFGELYAACQQDFGIKARQLVWKELGVSEQKEISDTPADCYRKIAEACRTN